MLNKKHNLKSGKGKDKKKGFQREKTRQETKKRENIDEEKLCKLNILMLFKKRKGKKETKTRKQKKAKRKTGTKKERKEE